MQKLNMNLNFQKTSLSIWCLKRTKDCTETCIDRSNLNALMAGVCFKLRVKDFVCLVVCVLLDLKIKTLQL
jgi:hypothetical protein